MEKLFEVDLLYKINMNLWGKGLFYCDSTGFPNIESFLSWVAFTDPDYKGTMPPKQSIFTQNCISLEEK